MKRSKGRAFLNRLSVPITEAREWPQPSPPALCTWWKDMVFGKLCLSFALGFLFLAQWDVSVVWACSWKHFVVVITDKWTSNWGFIALGKAISGLIISCCSITWGAPHQYSVALSGLLCFTGVSFSVCLSSARLKAQTTMPGFSTLVLGIKRRLLQSSN